MNIENPNLSRFFVVGINYKKTDATIRGDFAISTEQYKNIVDLAASYSIKEFFILSTCNRTEIYGFADNPQVLIDLLCSQTLGSKETFLQLAYIKNGIQAVEFLFEVGSGLESQILGDYEIVGQIKKSVKFSKDHGFVGAALERLVNCVLQSTKSIKNSTVLSGGTVSVSFAAVQYIKKHIENIKDKKIVLLGVGKIGKNTCKNLVDYLDTTNITLINRTEDKAVELAVSLGLHYQPFHKLEESLRSADVILVATDSPSPTVQYAHLEGANKKLIIDLSIPYNVEPTARNLPNVQLVNVDELSKLKDETLQKRLAEVPKAKRIIAEHLDEFLDWAEMRKNAPVLKALKKKLNDMHQCEMFLSTYIAYSVSDTHVVVNKHSIQKVLNTTAVKLKNQNQPGCFYIEAINDFMATNAN